MNTIHTREGVLPNEDVAALARALLEGGRGFLTSSERRAVARIAGRVRVGDVNESFDRDSRMGQRLADRVAVVGGSWTFVCSAVGFLLVWAGMNVWLLGVLAFDPYPFVFLNLLLSMLAALQAPIIMMSQNRQASKDRLAASMDRETSLRAEVEIMALHEKFDRLVERMETHGNDSRAEVAERTAA